MTHLLAEEKVRKSLLWPNRWKPTSARMRWGSLPSKATSTVFRLELGGGRWWSGTLARKQTTTSTVLKISSVKKKIQATIYKNKNATAGVSSSISQSRLHVSVHMGRKVIKRFLQEDTGVVELQRRDSHFQFLRPNKARINTTCSLQLESARGPHPRRQAGLVSQLQQLQPPPHPPLRASGPPRCVPARTGSHARPFLAVDFQNQAYQLENCLLQWLYSAGSPSSPPVM